MSRFFEKSDHIDDIEDNDIKKFLSKEKVAGKVEVSRVKDFYNALSSLTADEEIKVAEHTDYDYFNCQNEEDVYKIDHLKEIENDYLHKVNKDIINQGRLLKAATALAYTFEKSMVGGSSDGPPDPNQYLRNLFNYSEDEELKELVSADFGDLLEMDFSFLNYLALLSKKKAFAKRSGLLVKSENGPLSKYTMMEHIHEIGNMDLFQAVMPDFHKKVATKELTVRSRYEKKDRSQNLIILVDDSGSMSSEDKKNMLKAALTLKLKEESSTNNIYIGTFERELFGFLKAEKSMTFEDLRAYIHLSRGVTDVNDCVKKTISHIKNRRLPSYTGDDLRLSDDHFEVLVINDGQDDVDASYHPDIKLHALCLKSSNDQLKNICHRSGGTYFYIKGKHGED